MVALDRTLFNRTNTLTALAFYFFFLIVYCLSINMSGRNLKKWNFVFGVDAARTVNVLNDPRTVVDTHRHPLYLFLKAPTSHVSLYLGNAWRGTRLMTAGLGAVALPLAFFIFLALFGDRATAALFTALLGVSASVWLFHAIPEIYPVNFAAIVLAFFLQLWRVGGRAEMAVFHLVFVAAMVAAVGVSLSNGAYFALALLNFHRKRRAPLDDAAMWIALSALGFVSVFMLLSSYQNSLYLDAHTYLSFQDVADAFRADRIYFTLSARGLLDVAWLGTMLLTFLVDSVVAPTVMIKTFIHYGFQWSILGFTSPLSPAQFVIVAASASLLGYAVVQHRHRVIGFVMRDEDVQLAASFLAFNVAIHWVYRGIGAPFAYAIHAVFAVVFIVAVLYERIPVQRKKLVLAAVVAVIAINNLLFIRDTDSLSRFETIPSVKRVRRADFNR